MSINQRSRERVALSVFVLLLCVATVAVIAYFSTGRSWTIAATFVDDSVGSMEDYTAVIYSGTKKASEAQPAGTNVSQVATRPDAIAQSQYSFESALSSSDDGKAPIAASIGLTLVSMYPRDIHATTRGAYLSDVNALYEGKGAHAVTINTVDEGYYATPTILDSGDKKVGVFSVGSYMTRSRVSKVADQLREDGADVVIFISSRPQLLATTDGIDALLLTENVEGGIDLSSMGSAAIVLTPDADSVGTLIFTSNNLPSYRNISEL